MIVASVPFEQTQTFNEKVSKYGQDETPAISCGKCHGHCLARFDEVEAAAAAATSGTLTPQGTA